MNLQAIRQHLNQTDSAKPCYLEVPAKSGNNLAGGMIAVSKNADGTYDVSTSRDKGANWTTWLKKQNIEAAAKNVLWAMNPTSTELTGTTLTSADTAKFNAGTFDGLKDAERETLINSGISAEGLQEAERIAGRMRR